MTESNSTVKYSEKETSEETNQYVTFMIAGDTYGVSVNYVQSINEMVEITHVAQRISFMEGVINLRGKVVPVVNMRKMYNIPCRDYDLFTVILIVELNEKLIGMIVDSVSDVVGIPVSDIQKEIQFSVRMDKSAIEGIGRVDNQLVILLDINFLFEEGKEILV